MNRRRKKFTLKKLKKMFINLGKNVINFFKSLYNNFMSLPNKVRYIVYVWLIVILLVIIMILLTSRNNKFLEEYKIIETEMNSSSLDYVETNAIYPTRDKKLKLELGVLKDYGYIYDSVITDKTCDGYSLVYYDDAKEEYMIKSYINCKKYTTEDYFEYKES